MSGHQRDLKLTGDRNECPDAANSFNSSAAFDMHRVGSFGKRPENGGRRYRTVAEMTQHGMAKNTAGFWCTELKGKNAMERVRRNATSDFSGPEASEEPVSVSAAPSVPRTALNPRCAWPFPQPKA